jgi:hypothetical protein
MADSLQRIYLDQAKQECDACFAAIHAFNAALSSHNQEDPFCHAMTLVHHAASLSRIFWPAGGRNKTSRLRARRRGEFLRKELGVRSDHPIRDRALRDHFEHFDERLDEWVERTKNRNIIHRLLGPRSAVGGNTIQDGDIIHHYDPTSKMYAFRGEKFDIQAIASGIDDLYAKIQQQVARIEARRTAGHG